MLLYPDHNWADVALNGPQNRNHIVPVDTWRVRPGTVDAYRTIGRFPESLQEHVKAQGSVKGYHGTEYADWLPVDIDAEHWEDALETARQACDRLEVRFDMRPDDLRIFFSGAKGFHLLVPAPCIGWEPRTDLARVMRQLVALWLGDLPYDTSIYEPMRLFRLAGTINSKTGLYKIPLSAWELYHATPDEIREWARAPRRMEWEPMEPQPGWQEAYAQVGHQSSTALVPAGAPPVLSPYARPCYVSMQQGVGAGDRHGVGMVLASWWTHQGMPTDSVVSALAGWNVHNTPPLEADRAAQEFPKIARDSVGYDYGCHDATRQKFCAPTCPIYAKVFPPVVDVPAVVVPEAPVTIALLAEPISDILTAADGLDRYFEYVKDRQLTGGIRLGVPSLDEKIRGLAPGEVVQILARSGVGKTAFVLNLLWSMVFQQGHSALFFSLEMPVAQIVERAIQITTNASGQQIEDVAKAFLSGESNSQAFGQYLNEWGRLRFVEKDSLTLTQIRRYAQEAAALPDPPKVLAIDYLGRMEDESRSSYDAISKLAKGLKAIAKETQTAIVCLHQTSRKGGDGSTPITVDMGRDSGQIEEAADFVLGLWRPDITSAQSDEYEPVDLAVLKSRRSAPGMLRMWLRKASLRMGSPQYVSDRLGDVERYRAMQAIQRRGSEPDRQEDAR